MNKILRVIDNPAECDYWYSDIINGEFITYCSKCHHIIRCPPEDSEFPKKCPLEDYE